MSRASILSRLAGIVVLSASIGACGQLAVLKARRHFMNANELYKQSDWRKAAAEYEEAIKADPNLNEAYFYLANSYDNLFKPARKGEPGNDQYLTKAVDNYTKAAERIEEPKLKKLSLQYLAAAYATEKLNDPDKAEPVVKKMIAMDPKDVSSHFGLARIYEDAGRFEEAEAMLVQAKEAQPNAPEVYSEMSGFYNRRGQFDKAVAAMEQQASLDANNPQNYYSMGVFFEEKVRKDYTLSPKAKQEYLQRGLAAVDKALSLNPDYIDAMVYKGLLLRQQALAEGNPARQKALIAEADRVRDRALELQKLKAKGVGAS
jgi:tetratricopeptide (TPR) repeat protein